MSVVVSRNASWQPTSTPRSSWSWSSRRWVDDHADIDRLRTVVGDAVDPATAEAAADAATSLGSLTGWVNNAAVFRDADLHTAGADAVALGSIVTTRLRDHPASPRTSAHNSARCTRLGERAKPTRSPLWSPSCCRTRPASSTAPCSRSTADGPPSVWTQSARLRHGLVEVILCQSC